MIKGNANPNSVYTSCCGRPLAQFIRLNPNAEPLMVGGIEAQHGPAHQQASSSRLWPAQQAFIPPEASIVSVRHPSYDTISLSVAGMCSHIAAALCSRGWMLARVSLIDDPA